MTEQAEKLAGLSLRAIEILYKKEGRVIVSDVRKLTDKASLLRAYITLIDDKELAQGLTAYDAYISDDNIIEKALKSRHNNDYKTIVASAIQRITSDYKQGKITAENLPAFVSETVFNTQSRLVQERRAYSTGTHSDVMKLGMGEAPYVLKTLLEVASDDEVLKNYKPETVDALHDVQNAFDETAKSLQSVKVHMYQKWYKHGLPVVVALG